MGAEAERSDVSILFPDIEVAGVKVRPLTFAKYVGASALFDKLFKSADAQKLDLFDVIVGANTGMGGLLSFFTSEILTITKLIQATVDITSDKLDGMDALDVMLLFRAIFVMNQLQLKKSVELFVLPLLPYVMDVSGTSQPTSTSPVSQTAELSAPAPEPMPS